MRTTLILNDGTRVHARELSEGLLYWLAFAVLPLVIITLVPVFRRRWDKHTRIARWAMPIWLYVSVTGGFPDPASPQAEAGSSTSLTLLS